MFNGEPLQFSLWEESGGGGGDWEGNNGAIFFHSECVLQLLCFATRGPKS